MWLDEPDEPRGELRCAAREDNQQPGRKRVEGPRVPGLSPCSTPGRGYERERRGPRRLVEQDDPGRVESARRHHTVVAATNPATRRAVISSTGRSVPNPAAWRCPPPP